MNKTMKRILAACFTLAMITLVFAVPASAKTIKPKETKFLTSYNDAYKISTAVKQGVTYKVKMAYKRACFLRFKVPKTKTYTFKCYNITGKNSDIFGYFYVMRKYSSTANSITMTKVKTQGGNASTLWISKKGSNKVTETSYLKSRYGKVKLNKGEVVFIYIYSGYINTVNLKIS